MDGRWFPASRDSRKDVRVLLHPTQPIWEVRRGLQPASDDSIDLSPYVTQGSHSAFEASITLKFNRELFGDQQPKPFQVLEIQLYQRDVYKPCWLGIVDAINSFSLQRGERSMQIVAKSREQQDIWKTTKRLTPLFPQLTDLSYMIMRVARSAGMKGDEILLPYTSFTTSHSNTQMADMSAWEMVQTVCTPLGWTPFIDVLGRLRMASRDLQHRVPDIYLEDERLVKVGGQRQRPPKSRVRVLWLNPTLKKYKKQDQPLGPPAIITLGWFIPYLYKTVYFSDDRTQRAEKTRFKADPSVNTFAWTPFVRESWVQQAQNHGKLSFVNYNFAAVVGTIIAWHAMHNIPDTVPGTGVTVPVGRRWEAVFQILFCYLMLNCGTGKYQIWGTPYDWVHARNISEAFDSSVPTYVDNTVDIENDFIVNEEHAKLVAIRELIYQAREANKWSVTIVDDPRIEFGDVLQFYDGSQLYVEDFSRSLERGSEATLDVSGFLIPLTKTSAGQGWGGGTDSPPGVDGGGESALGIPEIGKPCWLGWFEFTNTLAYIPPSNCNMWVQQTGEIQTPDAHQFAQWVQGESVDDIEAQVAAATEPCVAYWDARAWPRYPTLRPQDWLALQAYCLVSETPAQFETAMRAALAAAPSGQHVCLVCQCYTSNTGLTTDLAGLVAVYARLARDHASVTMLLVFSDQGRGTGLNDHPTVKPYWQDLFEGIPVAPDGSSPGEGGPGGGGGTTMPQPPDHSSDLTDVRDRLIANGESLVGSASGKIVRQFAWEHRDDKPYGYGVLEKSGGNNWEGASVDYLCYGIPGDYRVRDCIGDAGGANNISWGAFESPQNGDFSQYVRVDSDPGYL